MRTHIAKTWYFMPSIYRHLFDSIPPPPIPQVDGGGYYREKFFFDFYFSDFARNLRMVGLRIFFEFYTRYSYLGKFFLFFSWLRSYSDSYSILFRISVVLTHYNFRSIFLVCLRYISLVFVSTCFSIDDYTLQLFISLTLLLVINKHLCLYEFVLCLFWLF